ncbi:MAG: hypothetical protein KDE27_21460, partial [Planctomycetes bacterium]|nr:hypothetical protein [Planctomycetota bacterium]
AWRPDVSTEYDAFAPRSLVVVFQTEDGVTFSHSLTSEIRGVVVDVTNETAGSPFLIAESADEDCELPSVGGNESGNGWFTVGYQVIGNSAQSMHVDCNVQLRRVDRSGAVTPPRTLGATSNEHELAPRIGGFDDDIVLAFMRARPADVGPRPANVNGHAIGTMALHWDGANFLTRGSASHDPQQNARLVLAGIDVDRATGSHSVLSFRSIVTKNVYLRVLGYHTYQVRAETVYVSPGNETTAAGAVAYDRPTGEFLIAYARNGALGSSAIDRYEHVTAPAPSAGGAGCSAAAFSWSGSQLIGDENCRIRLDGLPGGALATVLIGLAPINQLIVGVPQVQPGCFLNVPNMGPSALGTLPFAFGPTVSYDIDLPEQLPPMTLYFQGVHFDAGNVSVLTTQRFAVPLVK